MKRKALPRSAPVIDQALLEQAKRAIATDQIHRLDKCSVCAAPCATEDQFAAEDLKAALLARNIPVTEADGFPACAAMNHHASACLC